MAEILQIRRKTLFNQSIYIFSNDVSSPLKCFADGINSDDHDDATQMEFLSENLREHSISTK